MTRFSDAFDVAAHNARARAGWDKPAAPAKPAPAPAFRPLERDIQRAILQLLAVHPRVAWAARMNVGQAEHLNADGTTRRVRFAFRGCPDIIGQLKDGRSLLIEVKRADGRMTEDQVAFLSRAARYHALAFVARSAADVVRVLEQPDGGA